MTNEEKKLDQTCAKRHVISKITGTGKLYNKSIGIKYIYPGYLADIGTSDKLRGCL